MRIMVESQPTLLNIRTINAKTTMHTELPKIELETENANLNMQSTLPKIQIDQSQCFSESGLKSSRELTAENASRAVQEMYASIGRIVDQGNEMTNYHNGANIVAEQAFYNAYDQFDKEFGMVTMPMSRPNITLSRGKVDTNYQPAKVISTPRLSKPEINYEAGKVDVTVKRYNSIKFSTIPSSLDLKG